MPTLSIWLIGLAICLLLILLIGEVRKLGEARCSTPPPPVIPYTQQPEPAAPAPIHSPPPPRERRHRTSHEGGGNRAMVHHRQPDGSWQPVGHVDFGSKSDPETWPQRLHDELATDGRMIVWPDGEEQEHPHGNI